MAIYGGRSPFYSMWLYSVAWALSLWGVLITQAVATAWIIWRAATHAAGVHRFEAGVAIVALGALGAGAGFVTGFVMPDIYAAVAIICVALLFAYADQMSPLERVGLAAILAVSAVFHKTHLAIAAALILAGIGVTHFLRSEKRPLRSRALLATASALGVAVALQLAFDTAARAVLGTNPKPPPFLTMRLLVDGPGRLYLDSVCPGTATFLVCAYRNQSFKSSDEFYVGAFQALPVEQRLKLIEEEPRFVTAVAMHYPLSVLKTAVANAVEQFVLIWPAEAWIDPGVSFSAPAWSGADLFQVAPFLSSCVANLGKCVPALPEALIASSVIITVVLSFVVIAVHFVAAKRRATVDGAYDVWYRHRRAIIFAFLILVGLIVNAGICGAIAGPHTRYQTRVVWLVVLAAGVLEATHPIILAWFRRRRC
jgi:hypothetical protein